MSAKNDPFQHKTASYEEDQIRSYFENAGFKDFQINTAYDLEKENARGTLKTYPVFLATAVKN